MKTLRPYQQAAVNSIFTWCADPNNGHGLVVAPVGSGKSLLIAEFIRRVHEMTPRVRIVCVTHSKELLQQNADELRGQYPECDFGFYCAGLGQKRLSNDVTFASIQSIHDKVESFNRAPQIILIDECFTGDTLISTLAGDKRIDQVRLGDIIYNATGFGQIEAISKKLSTDIYKVKLSNGTEIRCTGNHPFLSEQGWIECKRLGKGTKLFGLQDMPDLWGRISTVEKPSYEKRKDGGNLYATAIVSSAKMLRSILCKEIKESNAQFRNNFKSKKDAYKNWSQACSAWWERQRVNKVSRNDVGNIGEGMDSRISYKNRRSSQSKNLSDLLQSGYRKQKIKISNRIGWGIAQREKENSGQKERRIFNDTRVENIEIEKRGSGEFVYNLQIGGHPSYFAGGVLVHNCHLIPHNDETTYRKFIKSCIELNSDCKVIGFTGTPFRADTGRLDEGEGALFDGIAYQIEMAFMVKEGFWAKPITPKTETVLKVEGVGTRNGDYIAGQLEKAVDIDEKTKACVAEIVAHGKDRRKWLIFTAGLTHCEHVRDAIRAHGISCEMVTGETPKEERDSILARYKMGEIRALTNVAVLTTGFNAPEIDLLAYMRPTRSPVLYVQTAGRGVRPVYADGFDLSTRDGRLAAIDASVKKDVMILDFGNVINTLGPIDSVDIRKKEKREVSEDFKPIIKICPSCGAECAPAQRYCYSCSYQFPFAELDKRAARNATIMSSDIEPETYTVWNVGYYIHQKRDDPEAPPTMRASYATDGGSFSEWIPFESPKDGGIKLAVKWHMERLPLFPVPKTVAEAVELPYPKPETITIRKEGKYNRIIEHHFRDSMEPIKPENYQFEGAEEINLDDEIPF